MRAVALLLMVCVLGGCVRGHVLRVESDPPGAQVWLNGRDLGQTPAEVELVHGGRYDLRVERDGFRPYWGQVRVWRPIWDDFSGFLPDDHQVETVTLAPWPASEEKPADLLERAQEMAEIHRRPLEDAPVGEAEGQ